MRKKQGKRRTKKGRRKRDRELDLAKQQELFPLQAVETQPVDYGPLFSFRAPDVEPSPSAMATSQNAFEQRELFE